MSRRSGLSRKQRGLGRPKLAQRYAHVTRDSDTTFKVKRSKVNLQGAGHIVVASRTACLLLHGRETRLQLKCFARKRCITWEVEGIRQRGRPKKTWWDCAKNDMESLGRSQNDTQSRNKWRRRIKGATG